jgi:hypothetical protein
VEYLFIGMAISGVIAGIYLNYYDFTHGNVLNSPPKGIKKENDDDDDEEEEEEEREESKKSWTKKGIRRCARGR